jgi:hypothetical protein
MFIGELFEELVEKFGHRYDEPTIQAMMFECLGHMVSNIAPDASAHFFKRADETALKLKAQEERRR